MLVLGWQQRFARQYFVGGGPRWVLSRGREPGGRDRGSRLGAHGWQPDCVRLLRRRVGGALPISTITDVLPAHTAQATRLGLYPSPVSGGRLPLVLALVLALALGHQRGLAGLAHRTGVTRAGPGEAASPATVRSGHTVRFALGAYIPAGLRYGA
eukprot:scaffold17568_cov56-Phaeocystis_antarctica.AAC.2